MNLKNYITIISVLVMSSCARNSTIDNVQVAAMLYQESRVALSNSEDDLAASLIDSAITINPLNSNYYYAPYGLLLSDQNNSDKAISMFRQAIMINTDYSSAKLIRVAEEYEKLANQRRRNDENYQAVCNEGITFFEEIFGKYPEDEWVNTCLGTCYYALGEVDSAEYYLKVATESNTSKLSDYHKLGELYYSTFRLNEANQIFTKALEIDKTDRISKMRIGQIANIKTAIRNHDSDPDIEGCRSLFVYG